MVQKDDNISLTFCFNYPNGQRSTSTCECDKTAKVLSKVIRDKIKNSEQKYGSKCCILKLPNDTERDILSIMSDPVELESTLEEVIGSINTEEEPSLEISIDYSNEPIQSFDDDAEESSYEAKTKKTLRRRHRNTVTRFLPSGAKARLDMVGDNDKSADSSKRIICNNIETAEPNYVGLVNQAMTCYLNSLLQALYMTPEFRNALYIWEYESSGKDTETNSIPYQLQKLFLNLQTSQKPAVETTSLTRSFGWDSNEAWHQHDIQELCRVMFDALEQKFKNTAQADLINRLYEGKINDYVKCLTCNTVKSREDTFLDIPLPVRPFDTNVAYGSVEEALEAFVKYETLEGNNQYFCEKCDKKSNAHKGLKFTKFPYILTLQLKRFDFDQNTYHRIKLNDKVTFPDTLNLNTFIESTSNQESPSREEDAGMSIKCDDSITTDSSTMDEEYTSCDITMSNSNHLTNHDQDDDEGIDMSNGMSSSSSSMHNNNSDKIREEYAVAKGPYIYELFSIMIHSGSASGGHYYAYIKDFRNDKWLCFNDQIVTPITQDEIQKTYGGGNRPGYFSGAYRSSTNAYMLMYRQIDSNRNAFPMKAEDFPPHIKELLEKIKKCEEDRSYHDEPVCTDRRLNKPIYYRHPATGEVKEVLVSFRMSMTLAQVAEAAYKEASIDDLVELDQCRIVSYFPQYDLVETAYDQDDKRLDAIFDNSSSMKLLLDIRLRSKKFESYPPDPIITKVYVIDAIEKNMADGPKYIRAYQKQTVREFKQELRKHFNLDPNTVQLLCQEIQTNKLLDDDFVFENLTVLNVYKIAATDSYEKEMLKNLQESIFLTMSEYLDDIVTFYIDPSRITKEQVERLSIPSLEEYYREEKTQEDANSPYCCVTEELSKMNVTTSFNYKAKSAVKRIVNQDFELIWNNDKIVPIVEDGFIHETSNSEDSSLSDSDRTLVGDVPEESELDCESVLTPAERFTGSHFYPNSLINKNDESELVKYFKVTPLKNQKLLKISMDYRNTADELKEKLESHFNIPKDYYRIMEYPTEEPSPYNLIQQLSFKEDRKYSICLGRILSSNELKLDIHMLDMTYPLPLRLVSSIFIKKSITVGSVKRLILAEIKRKRIRDLPQIERWRFIERNDDMLGDTLNDDEKRLKLFTEGICVQELPTDSLLSDNTHTQVYVRKWDRTEMNLEKAQDIIVSNDNFSEQLKEKILSMSNIPVEYLELCTLVWQCIWKHTIEEKIENCKWRSDINLDEVDSKTFVLYKDSRETPKIFTEEEKNYMKRIMCRRERMSGLLPTPMNSSPRREKALKIHVDST